MTPLRADPSELERFVRALFLHAGEGGTVSLRAFHDDEWAKRDNDRPFAIRAVRLNGSGLEPLIAEAGRLADEAARAERPVVVCPPVATFDGDRAGEANLREGLAISVELDERPRGALATLRGVLGPPSLVIASGGTWTDPGTGEVQDKLHVHWRLKEPIRTLEDHARLRRARGLACDLVGADATSKPASHPMRWAGTVHRKDPAAPRLARIVEENQEAEIALEDALAELEDIMALREEHGPDWSTPPEAGPATEERLLTACAERIANDDLPWAGWNRLGMAFWRASGGSEAGLAAFEAFSRKSGKYDPAATRARWKHYRTSPPSRIGAGTLVHEARKADPDFLWPRGPGASPAEGRESGLAAAIEEMNRRYFVAGLGGKGVIASLVRDDDLRRERLVFSREQDLRLLYRHRHYPVVTKKGNEVWKDLGAAWLEHPRRRTYERIALIPNGSVPPGVYNLWRGYGVEPVGSGWPLLREHLLDVVCCGDRAHYDYLIGWCARCVQHPERRAEVAVVLRGEKGTGKGTVAQALTRIFRDHALHIFHARHLTGHFNAHLVDALFLFLDEAFWGGDKQGEGVLKGLITEPSLMVEPKGLDPFTVPNRLKILMASNNEWVVPASADERRYFVLDVGSHRRGDHAYFERLHAALEGGEPAAFLHDLLAFDLSGFNIRAVPHTRALNRQKLVGADSVTAFWHDCLREGAVIGTDDPGWPGAVVTQVLHAAYLEHAKDHGERHPATDARMVERLKPLWGDCDVRSFRSRAPCEQTGAKQPWRYRLASLERHREAFLRAMEIAAADHPWPAGEEDADA